MTSATPMAATPKVKASATPSAPEGARSAAASNAARASESGSATHRRSAKWAVSPVASTTASHNMKGASPSATATATGLSMTNGPCVRE